MQQDYAEAAKWYRKGTDRNFAPAQFNLCVLYRDGNGVPQDDAEAFSLCRRAAKQGFAPAELALGQMFLNGQGTAADKGAAVEWLTKAADGGNADAQYQLGVMYAMESSMPGNPVQKDLQKAAALCQKASDQGHAIAEFALGTTYWAGDGVKLDYGRAVRLFRSSAEQGYVGGRTVWVLHTAKAKASRRTWFPPLSGCRWPRLKAR